MRYAAFSQRRGGVALASDAIWVAGVALMMGAAFTAGTSSVAILLLAWGAPALGAAALSTTRLRVIPRPTCAMSWWRSQRDLAPRYLGEFAASSGAGQSASCLSWRDRRIGRRRSTESQSRVARPLECSLHGDGSRGNPGAVSVSHQSLKRLLRLSVVLSTALTASAICWGTVVVLLPKVQAKRFSERVGLLHRRLPQSWHSPWLVPAL